MTPLEKTLKRSLIIDGLDFVVVLSPESLKLTRKGRRLGLELKWADIASGESALALALRASVGRFDTAGESPAVRSSPGKEALEAKSRRRTRPRK